ncbi:MAG TPA: oxidoreductase [Lachnospiraceae bacterium]|nr:oxidoreductase [Lachnospiraceae bacterium]
MLTNDFKGINLSRLGFGTMRLPVVNGNAYDIDEKQADEMVRYAISHGINYFDTAYPYHGGMSEKVIGKLLSSYPRDSYYLATKYPGHQISKSYNPAVIFEEQLKKCCVEYFDFYLLHNVYENSIQIYKDKQWGIVDYFIEQKRQGRIKHLGFSSHGGLKNLQEFLDFCGDKMEFCQIQLNYLDWTLQGAAEKYKFLTEKGIGIWVMEPVRGGRLANLPEEENARLRSMRPDEKSAAWAFRFLLGLPNVKMILSGMSDMAQMVENVETFQEEKPLTDTERAVLLEIAESMKNSIPCTACRYCCDGCPQKLDIPMLISAYNEIRFSPSINVTMRLEALAGDKKPSACINCKKCTKICPQNIDIPEVMKSMAEEIKKLPSWAEICRQRDEAAKKLKEQQ